MSFEEEGSEDGLIEETLSTENEDPKWELARKLVRQMKLQLEAMEALLQYGQEPVDVEVYLKRQGLSEGMTVTSLLEGRAVEGVFDGEHMVGEDGRKYAVPANYASKSKLVEGDLLRLTITENGRFLFKQRGPIDRQRLAGQLIFDEATETWRAATSSGVYRVLSASVSYFHGESGDEVIILVPKNTPSRWAAVEQIIKSEGGDGGSMM